MIIDAKPELTKETLNSFIAETLSDLNATKDKLIISLQKKVNRLQNEEESSSEAAELSEITKFLQVYPTETLMAMVLLDKKIKSPAKQKALNKLKSKDDVKALINTFCEKYPNWKKSKKQLLPKMELDNDTEENNNESIPANGSGKPEDTNISKQSLKKKKRKKKKQKNSELNGSNSMPELMNGFVESEDVEMTEQSPKKKKKKQKNSEQKDNTSMSELPNGLVESKTVEMTEQSPKKKGEKKKPLPSKEKGKKHKMENGDEVDETPPKKKKKKAASSDASVTEAVNGTGSLEVKVKSKKKKQEKKLKGNFTQVFNNTTQQISNIASPTENESGSEMENDKENSQTKPDSNAVNGEEERPDTNFKPRRPENGFKNQQRRNERRGRPNRGGNFAERFKPGRNYADYGSPNAIAVSPDWQDKMIKQKNEDSSEQESKGSLLKPLWLTNPEEYKPPPLQFPSKRDNFGRKSFGGGRNGRRSFFDEGSSNAMPLEPRIENAEGATSEKKDDSEGGSTGGSLLKPLWMTNPEEYKATPLPDEFLRSASKGSGGGRWRGKGGGGKGRDRGKGRGRGKGRRR